MYGGCRGPPWGFRKQEKRVTGQFAKKPIPPGIVCEKDIFSNGIVKLGPICFKIGELWLKMGPGYKIKSVKFLLLGRQTKKQYL